MKEDEARKKWCPLSRVRSDQFVTRDGEYIGEAPFNRERGDSCLASHCMAWRTDHYISHRADCEVTRLRLKTQCQDIHQPCTCDQPMNGWCGAFGKE